MLLVQHGMQQLFSEIGTYHNVFNCKQQIFIYFITNIETNINITTYNNLGLFVLTFYNQHWFDIAENMFYFCNFLNLEWNVSHQIEFQNRCKKFILFLVSFFTFVKTLLKIRCTFMNNRGSITYQMQRSSPCNKRRQFAWLYKIGNIILKWNYRKNIKFSLKG